MGIAELGIGIFRAEAIKKRGDVDTNGLRNEAYAWIDLVLRELKYISSDSEVLGNAWERGVRLADKSLSLDVAVPGGKVMYMVNLFGRKVGDLVTAGVGCTPQRQFEKILPEMVATVRLPEKRLSSVEVTCTGYTLFAVRATRTELPEMLQSVYSANKVQVSTDLRSIEAVNIRIDTAVVAERIEPRRLVNLTEYRGLPLWVASWREVPEARETRREALNMIK